MPSSVVSLQQRQNLFLEYGWGRPDHDVLWKNVEGKDLGGQQCAERHVDQGGAAQSFQSRVTSAAGLETILVVCWQRMWLGCFFLPACAVTGKFVHPVPEPFLHWC